jgi:PAS domain
MSFDANPIAELQTKARTAGWGVEVDPTLAFERAELRQLHDLWKLKQIERNRLPERSDLDARLLKPFLRNLTIMEHVAGQDGKPHFKFRLQGMALVQYFGEQTGRMLEDSVDPEIVEAWNTGYFALLRAKRPMRVLTYYQMENVDYITGESFSVALGNAEQEPVSVLTVTYFSPRASARRLTDSPAA